MSSVVVGSGNQSSAVKIIRRWMYSMFEDYLTHGALDVKAITADALEEFHALLDDATAKQVVRQAAEEVAEWVNRQPGIDY